MQTSRNVPIAVVAGVLVLGGAVFFVLGPMGGKDSIASRGVREFAVGTWHCNQTWDGDVAWAQDVGITADGRFGFGDSDAAVLMEAGTWELSGLSATVTLSDTSQGYAESVELTYTGDADPPTELSVFDGGSGDPGHFSTTVRPNSFVASQQLTGSDGAVHTNRIACQKAAGGEPDVRKPS